MQCVCGQNEIRDVTERMGVAVVESGQATAATISVAECTTCGVVRQVDLPFDSADEWIRYYQNYPPTHEGYIKKTYDHDREVARARCDNYGVDVAGRMLDVGSGSGAFVDEVRDRGFEAYGCEIGEYSYSRSSEHIYFSSFENVHFPTDHFDTVTCHDVLEHVLNPVGFVAELFRVTRQYGSCLIDFPRFYHEAGTHHWKDAEHVWFFTAEQVEELLKKAGFLVTDVTYPIESKILFRAIKPVQKRVTVLIPPGIGDSYWSIIKLQSFIAKHRIGIPEVYVACNRVKAHDGHMRALALIEMFPFLCSSGKALPTGGRTKIWVEAYAQQGRTVIEDVLGCKYFVSYNGHLRHGEAMQDIDPDLEVDWTPPRFVSLEEEKYKAECEKQYGRYVVFYFVFVGTYMHWTKQFGEDRVIAACNAIATRSDCTPVFTGAIWDKEQDRTLNRIIRNVQGAVDLRGRTSLSQAFGLMRGAQAVVGYPSGLTIMSAVLNVKTMIIWNDYYNSRFFWNCAPPATREKTYFCANTKGLMPGQLADRVVTMMEVRT